MAEHLVLERGQISVLKVQATPNGLLADNVRGKIGQMVAPDGGRTLVVEAAGRPITAGLRNPDPGLAKGCPHRDECPVVPEQRCGGARMVYQLQCTSCGALYLGTSGHSLHKRNMEHLEAVRSRNGSYAMARHYMSEHPEWTPTAGDGEFPFISKIIRDQTLWATSRDI